MKEVTHIQIVNKKICNQQPSIFKHQIKRIKACLHVIYSDFTSHTILSCKRYSGSDNLLITIWTQK